MAMFVLLHHFFYRLFEGTFENTLWRKIKCKQCDFASSQPRDLRTNFKAHIGKKANICHKCDFKSAYKSALGMHVKTHSGEKSDNCHQCDFASFRAGHFRTHLITQWRKAT